MVNYVLDPTCFLIRLLLLILGYLIVNLYAVLLNLRVNGDKILLMFKSLKETGSILIFNFFVYFFLLIFHRNIEFVRIEVLTNYYMFFFLGEIVLFIIFPTIYYLLKSNESLRFGIDLLLSILSLGKKPLNLQQTVKPKKESKDASDNSSKKSF